MYFQKQCELRNKGGLGAADITGKLWITIHWHLDSQHIFLEFTHSQDLPLDVISLYVKVLII